MHLRVKIELPNQERGISGYATDEHGICCYGPLLIMIGDTPHMQADINAMGGTVVTSTHDVAVSLTQAGYPVRYYDPSARYNKMRKRPDQKQLSAWLSIQDYRAFEELCARRGTTTYAAIVKMVLSEIAE